MLATVALTISKNYCLFKKKPQAIFVFIIDIWTGFMFAALFGKFAIQTGIRILYSDDALLCIFFIIIRK